MKCSNCGNENISDAQFCMQCGKPLGDTPPATAKQTSSIQLGSSSVLPPAVGSTPGAPQQAQIGTGASGSLGTGPVSMWGPFAGYGQRGRHVAWLLDDCSNRTEHLRNAVQARFDKRQIPETTVTMKVLQLRGVNPDPRPYFLLQRRRATVALYISQFGKDLYVSQVSYSLGPLSMVRIWAFIGMAAYAVFYTPFLLGSIGATLGGDVSGLFGSILLFCCGGPLFFVSALGVLFGLTLAGYRFVTDRDIMAPFRVTANEFDNDDLIALEKAAEQTVRDSLDEVNVDRTMMPVAPQYGMRPQYGL